MRHDKEGHTGFRFAFSSFLRTVASSFAIVGSFVISISSNVISAPSPLSSSSEESASSDEKPNSSGSSSASPSGVESSSSAGGGDGFFALEDFLSNLVAFADKKRTGSSCVAGAIFLFLSFVARPSAAVFLFLAGDGLGAPGDFTKVGLSIDFRDGLDLVAGIVS